MTALTTTKQHIEFTPDQVALIKSQVAPNATNDELKLFLYQAQRTGLDPLTRQIYCIHRGGKMTIQTSIDGFRVIAERSGDYAGQSEPIFNEQDGKIISCSISVYRFRGDVRYQASVGVAYMAEYDAGGPMWRKMPHTMIAKCAEALALRKAYPQDLSGLYTADEMNQADYQPTEVIETNHKPVMATQPTIFDDKIGAEIPEAYKVRQNDADYIIELINAAPNTASLRLMHNINTAFFVSNPEVNKRLMDKGMELKNIEQPKN